MDPQLAWEELLQAWVRRDWESVVEYAEALLSWLDRGGFPPEMLAQPQLGIDFNWSIARAACAFARQRAYRVLDAPSGIPHDVPFTLTCSVCYCQGPESSSQAMAEGWRHIEYVPASPSENFLGTCPICLADSCWADQSTC